MEDGTIEKGNKLFDNKVVNAIDDANYVVEQLPRFTEFMTVIQTGGAGQNNVMKAMLASANITVNFGRSGTLGKMFNKTLVPFFNPAIQGTSNTIRVLTGQRGWKAFTKLMLKMVIFGVLPTFINNLMYKDDEEYKDLTQANKDINFLFKVNGKFIKIPKGRVMSVIGMLATPQRNWGEALQTALSQTAPSNPFTSNIVSPIINASINLTWYGTEIDNQRLKSYKPGERYDNATDIFSKAVGKALNKSPKRINYVLDSYSGVIGDFILPLLTPRAEQNPLVKQFTIDPKLNNKISNDFYDTLEKAQYEKNSKKDVASSVAYKYINSHTTVINDLNAKNEGN